MSAIGAKTWVLPLGHIPLATVGPEPECTSRDQMTIVNTTAQVAHVEIDILYAERDPVGPYRVEVQPRRLRVVRFNDLVDPLPIPLDVDFAAIVRADRPVIVQFSRFDSAAQGTTIVLPAMRFD